MHRLKLAAAAALLALAATTTSASATEKAQVEFVPVTAAPPAPAGLKLMCLTNPRTITLSKNCPVVKYQGLTTWAYTHYDNRDSMVLVSYTPDGKVARNVTKEGAHWVWNMVTSQKTRSVLIEGYQNKSVTVPWSELGR
jgi:hypothetical protein